MKIINRTLRIELDKTELAAFKRVMNMVDKINHAAYLNGYEDLQAASGEAENALTNTMYELDKLNEQALPDATDSDGDTDSHDGDDDFETTPCETCSRSNCIECENETIRPNY